eukprot:2244395-Alexandrium_andersonii.AAC.1
MRRGPPPRMPCEGGAASGPLVKFDGGSRAAGPARVSGASAILWPPRTPWESGPPSSRRQSPSPWW